MPHSVILIPFIFAILIYVLRFYVRERVASISNPSFLLASLTVLIAGAYLALNVLGALPPYGSLGFGIVGLALLVLAIARMFMM